mmetsp:Transcript_43044/g.74826  ORF Transcript_43044/g.74826 Transcript_43044/m.74826 type:complete len:204 (+) Transcript_43044:858-1469(+)
MQIFPSPCSTSRTISSQLTSSGHGVLNHHAAVGAFVLAALEHLVVGHVVFVRGNLAHHEQQTSSQGAHDDEQSDDQTQQRGGVVERVVRGGLRAVRTGVTIVAEASRCVLVIIISAVTVASAEVAVAHGALEGTAIDRRHRHGVHTVRVLQGMRGHRVELVHAAHLDVEHSLVPVGASAARITNLDALRRVLLVEQTDFGHNF